MLEKFVSIFIILFGLFFFVTSNSLANEATKFYERWIHLHINEAIFRIGFLLGGIGFMIFGVLSLFGIIDFSQ